jgi:hypothetical protein
MLNAEPGVNGSSTPDTVVGRAWEAAQPALRAEDLHFRSEPLAATGALFVRVMVEGPAGEVLYDEAIRADEGGLESGTRDVARATAIDTRLVEPRMADIITDARRQALPRGSGKSQAGQDDVMAGIVDLGAFLNQQEPEEWLVTSLPGLARTLGKLGRLAPGLGASYTVLRDVARNGSRRMGYGQGPARLPR